MGTKEYFYEHNLYNGLKCSICNMLMRDPVMAIDGHSYERSEIEKWFENGNNISPITGSPLLTTVVFPNHNLRKVIDDLVSRYPNLDQLRPKPNKPKNEKKLEATSFIEQNFFDSKDLTGDVISFSKNRTVASRTSPPEKMIDAIAIIATPLRITSNEAPYFCFQASEISTHFSGVSFGLTTTDPTSFAFELSYLIDDHSWFIDGIGWVRSPDGSVRPSGWNPAKIKKNDRIALRGSQEGCFQVFINDLLVVDMKCNLPVSDPLANFWGFVCLTGGAEKIELLGAIVRNTIVIQDNQQKFPLICIILSRPAVMISNC